MTNVAYADFGATHACKEPNVAELEDGYVKLANTLLDALLMADITLHQQKVMLAIIRKTYGFNKKVDRITNAQIAKITGLPETRVCTAKNQLLARKFLLMDGNCIGVNKVISEWQSLPKKGNTQNRESLPEKGKEIFPEMGNTQKGEIFPETGKKTFPEMGNNSSPKQGNTKDTITKDNKNNKTHSQLPLTANCAKPEKRKPNPLDCEAYLNAYNEIVGDRLPHAVEASNERKRKLKLLVESLVKPNLEGFQDYVNAFMQRARPFHFGDNDRGWVATFDFLLNRKTLTKIREGTL
ncbi:replication protein [Arsenophonus nasoniae]|uniref:Phage transcriptional regulator n=1 Tax=Arsenophonus nasoniae TaxID=638 RepID=D2U1C0_9GAMM|nr:replication protein [Arsenophonus nasoniae]WGM05015.1 replication protein [Arsenophonus nasoniae]CBA74504.1 phage transcriptional regulator [Arsenophonus nasoniae]